MARQVVGCGRRAGGGDTPGIGDHSFIQQTAVLQPSPPSAGKAGSYVDAAFTRMAVKVDAQNAADHSHRSLAGSDGAAIRAARALVFEGLAQCNGYTEPLLHAYRPEARRGIVL